MALACHGGSIIDSRSSAEADTAARLPSLRGLLNLVKHDNPQLQARISERCYFYNCFEQDKEYTEVRFALQFDWSLFVYLPMQGVGVLCVSKTSKQASKMDCSELGSHNKYEEMDDLCGLHVSSQWFWDPDFWDMAICSLQVRDNLWPFHMPKRISESGQVVWCFVRASLTSH